MLSGPDARPFVLYISLEGRTRLKMTICQGFYGLNNRRLANSNACSGLLVNKELLENELIDMAVLPDHGMCDFTGTL